ncbi:MAG: C1 family peptidase [Chloroflexota bacterium]
MGTVFRCILGSLFLSAGILKLLPGQQPPEAIGFFLSALPALAPVLPWVEIAVGLALLVGRALRFTVGVAIALVLAFIAANVQSLLAGAQEDCGCFGNVVPLTHWQALLLNVLMLGMALACLLQHGSRAITLAGEKKRRTVTIARIALSGIAVLTILAASFSPIPVPKTPWLAAADPQGQFQLAPLNPQFEEWQKSRSADRLQAGPQYGDIPLPMDLSHLKRIPVTTSPASIRQEALPSTFDWRTQSKVTSVKDQNPCGTCWTFAALASLESRIAIIDGTTYDFSEQNLACCTDPAYYFLVGNRCNGGGNILMSTETLVKKGARLESCQPYNTSTINSQACNDTCTTVVRVTDLRVVADDASQTTEIKNALYTYGPLRVSYRHDNSKLYSGNIYYWPNCTQNTNHAVTIVGWDDTVTHPSGGGTGAWIVKNSWGTAWANSGYFYLCYGSANLSSVGSYHGSNGYITPGANDRLYYWDEVGLVDMIGTGSTTSCWMASVFTAEAAGSLKRVEFWTVSNNAQYQAYVYNGNQTSTQVLTSQLGTCAEMGYYSIVLTSPVTLTAGQQFTVAVKMTTPGYYYPVPVECYSSGYCNPTIQTGKSYLRAGDSGGWTDAAAYGANACLRALVGTAAVAPAVETSAASNVTTNSATLNGNLTSLGSASSVNVYFEYGTTTSYGTPTSPQAKTATGAFSQDVTSLIAATGYHARAKADGGTAGTATGGDISFTTSTAVPLAVATTIATNVAATSATLNGNLTSLGSATTVNVSFEYGRATSYGNTTTAQAKTAVGPFSANLTGLTAGAGYHYRAKADGGGAGVVYGADMAFPMSWQWQNPLPQGNPLRGVWGSSSSDVFAVGDGGTILHYNGNAWSTMTSGTTGYLNGVWGSSASDVFAVGETGTILHYNGTAWTAMSSGTNNTLTGVWGSSATDVFAVGANGTIVRYNGSAWSAMTSGTTNYLNGVWGSSASDIFAVGQNGIILHYNGSAWSTMTSGDGWGLGEVWGSSASDVFAVGKAILHYNGSTWSTMSSPGFDPTGNPLSGLWGSSASDVFAVGYGGTILHYNGSAWSAMTSNANNTLNGAWGSSASDVFAVGDGGTILHYNGSAWSATSSGVYYNLYGLWGTSASDAFASGAAGRVLRYNGTTWSATSTDTNVTLNGIWGSSASNVFAVGDGGVIRHYNGSTWSAMTSGTINALYGVWGSSASDVFAVGLSGTILRYNGSAWSAMSSGTAAEMRAVWGSSATDVFAVGSGGVILHYNGSAWSAMTSGASDYFYTGRGAVPLPMSLLRGVAVSSATTMAIPGAPCPAAPPTPLLESGVAPVPMSSPWGAAVSSSTTMAVPGAL